MIGHYNRVARILADDPGSYVPLLDIDPHCDEVMWELWVGGFERGMRLRTDTWAEIVESDDEEAAASVTMLLTLNECREGPSKMSEETIDELCGLAPALLPDCVHNLNAWTKSRWDKGRGKDGGMRGDLHGFPIWLRRPANLRAQGGPKRAVSLRIGPQIQAVLRRQLIASLPSNENQKLLTRTNLRRGGGGGVGIVKPVPSLKGSENQPVWMASGLPDGSLGTQQTVSGHGGLCQRKRH